MQTSHSHMHTCTDDVRTVQKVDLPLGYDHRHVQHGLLTLQFTQYLTAQSGAAIGCSECFRHTFLPLSGRDLGTIKAFGTIQWFTLVT